MKRLTYVRVIVLGLALTTAPVGADSDDRSVTAATSGLFAERAFHEKNDGRVVDLF